MFRQHMIAAILAGCSLASASVAIAAEAGQSAPAAPAATAYNTADTDIGTLLDNPATKAILDKHLPQLTANSQIDLARSMTLKQVQSYASDMVTDDVLARIDADLAKIPAQK